MWALDKLATPIIVGVVVSIITFLFQRRAEKREQRRDKKASDKDKIREEIDSVDREVNSATMQLAYATAVAVERGKTNGELKKAKEAYDKATKAQKELGDKLIAKEKKE